MIGIRLVHGGANEGESKMRRGCVNGISEQTGVVIRAECQD
jgi:hypothetical protein